MVVTLDQLLHEEAREARARRACGRIAITPGSMAGATLGDGARAPRTVDSDSMSFDAIVATDHKVIMNGFEGVTVEEILVASGGRLPRQVPLLDTHMRREIGNVLGTVGQFRNVGSEWFGHGTLAAGVPAAEEAFLKIAAGHLTDLSVGYRVLRYNLVPAGGKETIQGVLYEASRSWALQVITEWELHEVSLVPIGADQAAKIRHGKKLREKVSSPSRWRNVAPNRRRRRNV